MGGPRILISAGEASGDRLGAGLARALRERRPGVELVGMGGPRMREAGVRIVQDAGEVAVVGIFEVLARLGALRRAMRRLESALVRNPPDVLVPIDFPDFHLRLAVKARAAAVEVVYFVSPQLWAWRRGRVRIIRRLVRRMLVLFPFETEFYEQAGVPVTFVGHPAAERQGRPTDGLRARAGLAADSEVLALLPGSREGEVSRHVPAMAGAALLVRQHRPRLEILVPVAPGLEVEPLRRAFERHGLTDVRLHHGDYPEILSVCSAGVVASGTATLEAALEGLPIVVVYRVHPLTYAIGKRLVRVPHVALPNLVLGRRLFPELLQRECSAERIADHVLRDLETPSRVDEVRRGAREIEERLGGPGVFDRAARALLGELEAS